MEPASPTTVRNEQTFLAWLNNAASTPNELVEWLVFGFHRGPEQPEPQEQLFAALPLGGDNYPLRCRLAGHLAQILDRYPSLDIPFKNAAALPPYLVARLLSFAAYLNCPDVLADPLLKVRSTLLTANQPVPPPLQVALTEAVLNNQKCCPELREVWLRMTAGQPDPLFGGVREIGMEGIAMMEGEAEDQPDRSAIGQGLLDLARAYAADPKTRRQRFRIQVLRLKRLWDLRDTYFIQLANDHQWVQQDQGWAVDALPELFATNFYGVPPGDEHCALVWHWFARCLLPWKQLSVEDNSICGGRVWLVRFSPELSRQLDLVIGEIKKLAITEVLNSEHEANCYIERTMTRLVEFAKKRDEQKTASALEATQALFRREANLIFAQ